MIGYEKFGDVAVLRMDDGKANALSSAMIDAITGELDRAQREAKAVALFGRPGRFSAGFDLKVMMASKESAMELLGKGGELFLRLLVHPQPVVIGVSGHALAGGVLLSSCGDVRIGVRGEFKLGLNEIAIGMPVPILAQELARARLDVRRFTEATLLAGVYDPEEALKVGWLDRVSSPEAFEGDVLSEATRLAAFAGDHFAITKRTLRAQTVSYIRATMEENLRDFGVKPA